MHTPLSGLYLASGSQTGELCIWDISTSNARVVATASVPPSSAAAAPVAPSCLAWRPGSNEIVVSDEAGRVGVWTDPVPSTLQGPSATAEEAAKPEISGEYRDGALSRCMGETSGVSFHP